MTVVVDAHHHFWRAQVQHQEWRTSEHEAIARDYEPVDLLPEMRASGVHASVLVESVDTADENDRLARYAAATATVAGVVAWLPLRDEQAARAELDRIAHLPRLCGVRCLVGREPLSWLADPRTVELFRELGRRGLSWDVVPVTPDQVEAVEALARQVPELRIVVDHLARPPLDTGGWEPWASQVRALAAHGNVAMKVSLGIDVLTSWRTWQPDALDAHVAWAVECFGPERLMTASNWPVALLWTTYRDTWQELRTSLGRVGVTGAGLDDVCGGTAVRWYGLMTGRAGAPGTDSIRGS